MNATQIKKIEVKNFKSLSDFKIEDLPMFVCLIGINGAGKTTFLQLLDFIKALMKGQVSGWLERQGWTYNDLLTMGSGKFTIDLTVEAVIEGHSAIWTAKFNARELRCTYEKLEEDGVFYEFESGKLIVKNSRVNESGRPKITDFSDFKFEGSIFSHRESKLASFFQSIQQFGVLNPHTIAQPTRTNAKGKMAELENDGKNLSGFIAGLAFDKQEALWKELQKFYPPLKKMEIKRQQFGWKSLLLSELEKTVFSASNLSYGTLRLFVILSQQYADYETVVFDEIENGLNQELFKELVNVLLHYGSPQKQVIVTTHSGLLLNYLPDDTARESVFFLSKGKERNTIAQKFFDIPKISEKLNVLGPGEVMGDTDLIELSSITGKSTHVTENDWKN